MSLEYFFLEEGEQKPKIHVSQPVNHGFLIKNAFTFPQIKKYFTVLSAMPWLIQEIVVAGSTYMPMRETLGFVEQESKELEAKKSSKTITYPKFFDELRNHVRSIIYDNINEIEQPPEMNFCWGNRYRDGRDKVGKHKDNETGHSKIDPIVSVSFGTPRYFDIYRENKIIDRTDLGFGDIFLMMPGFQEKYYHAVPKQMKIKDPRINLTFRSIDLERYKSPIL